LKTNYALLNKVAHCVRSGVIIHDFANSIYGGYAGGSEGIGVVSTAAIMLLATVNLSTTHSICPSHPFFNSDTAPEIIWAISAAQQAINRNTHLLTAVMTSPVSGPATESLLFEVAAMTTATTVSGTARIDGVRSAVGVVEEHFTGLEARFMGEIAYAATGVSRVDANRMVAEFQKGYVDLQDKQPIGKSFSEVYDIRTLTPTDEWLEIYARVKEKVENIGLKFVG
jgi:methylamine--corrinoid protein Co-methyltransferase